MTTKVDFKKTLDAYRATAGAFRVVVMPLEAFWSAPDMASFTSRRDKSQWDWAALSEVRLETLEEGRCVQTLHLGAFDHEGLTLARLHDEFIPAEGFRMSGRHHEIYLSDLRKVEAAKLRTILRQPVASL